MLASKPLRTPLVYPCGEPPVPGMAKEIVPGVLWLRRPLPLFRLHGRLNHLDRSHRRALEGLQVLLAEGPQRVVDVFSVLFARKIDGCVLSLATGEALANLNYLIERGRAVVTVDVEGVAWYQLSSMQTAS